MEDAPFTLVLRSKDRKSGSANDCLLAPQLTTFLADAPYWKCSIRSVLLPIVRDAKVVSTYAYTPYLEWRLSFGSAPFYSDTDGAPGISHFA